MNKFMLIGIPIFLVVSGYLIGDFMFQEIDEGITLEQIYLNPMRYVDEEIQIRGFARMHSAREFIVLDDGKYFIYVKHNMKDAYFKYGERYDVKGMIKSGRVFGVEEDTAYIDATETMIRNNSLGWI